MNNFNPRLVGSKSDQGPVRDANEDAFWVSSEETPTDAGALYIVADGVGGQEHGAAAANRAVQVINQVFYQQRRNNLDIPQALQIAIQTANEAILAQSQASGISKMGCTVVTAVQHNGRLHIAHVGDARAYLLSGEKLSPLTRDDTWVQKQVEAGIITPEQAAKHELRNVVTQVLGNKEEIEVHLAEPRPLQPNDAILLCSDGLHDKVPDAEIVALLSGYDPQTAAEKLVAAAIAAETHDNVTAVVVKTDAATAAHQKQGDTASVAPIISPTEIDKEQPPAKPAPPPQTPLVPAATDADKPRSGPPLWALITLGIIAILLIVGGIILLTSDTLSLQANNAGAENRPAAPALQPITNETATLAPAATVPTENPAAAPLLPTSTLLPTQTPTAQPTATATNLPPPRACLIADQFLWEDAQLNAGDCNQFAQTALDTGTEIIILDSNPRQVDGPDAACESNQFIRVRTAAEPVLEGWVLQPFVESLAPGESCTP